MKTGDHVKVKHNEHIFKLVATDNTNACLKNEYGQLCLVNKETLIECDEEVENV
jgi:hypothetical protein